jgi:hypothetical protein
VGGGARGAPRLPGRHAPLLGLLPAIAEATGFFALTRQRRPDDPHSRATHSIPEHQAAMAKVLVPPPVAKSDEIIAASGGMFYGRETPVRRST